MALLNKWIRTLDSDEQDELLDEIQGVSSRFFRQKRQHLRAAKNTSNTTVNADLPPPPPLTAAGQVSTRITDCTSEQNW